MQASSSSTLLMIVLLYVCAVGEASGASICLHHRHWHRHSTGATTTQPISGAATQPSNGTTTTTCS
jgi:hypothetical protein